MDLITYDSSCKIHRNIISDEHKLFIINNCKSLSNKEISAITGIPEKNIRYFIHHQRLHPKTSRPYTKSEVEFIKKNFRILSFKEMGQKISRTLDSVRKKAKDLKLKRSAEDSIFLQEKYCCKTYYPKNHQPGNTLFDGAVTIRDDKRGVPHKFIRISRMKWVELQVYNWKQKNGTIPAGMVLKCKNGNTLDCQTDNWELITKTELLERNSGRRELTDKYITDILAREDKEARELIGRVPDLIDAKRTELKLRRIINEHNGKNTGTVKINDRKKVPIQG